MAAYGVPIPPDHILTALPEPYNPAKHGAPLSDTDPDANMAARSTWDPPSHGLSRPPSPLSQFHAASSILGLALAFADTTGHEGKGWNFSQGRGIYAQVDVQRNVTIPIGWDATMYAPTHMPANGSCYEATIMHYRTPGNPSGPTSDFFGLWDWCTPAPNGWRYAADMDATGFLNKYVRVAWHTDNSTTEAVAVIQVVASDPSLPFGSFDCWKGLIYNFSSGLWEQKGPNSCGNETQFPLGWSMWEAYALSTHSPPCPSFPGITAESLLYLDSGGLWHAIFDPPTNKSPLQFGSPSSCWAVAGWTFDEAHLPNMWHAHTPTNNQ